jgi:uncharacterized coiled-coil protein SlyX
LEIPIPGSEKFDVIICFEGIEHVEEHEKLLSEVKRLLKKNGLFIISSPNKKTYSDDPAYINPFHKKELYFTDFRDLLNKYFRNLLFFGQKVFGISSIWPLPPCVHLMCEEFVIEKKDNEFYFSDLSEKSPQFFIAVASDKKLDQESCTISNLLGNLIDQHTKNLEKIVANREIRISTLELHTENLEKIVADRETKISNLEKMVADKETKISDLEKMVVDKETKISDLEKMVVDKETKISDLEKMVADKETKISGLEKMVVDKETKISDLEKMVVDKETKISEIEKTAEDLHKLLGVRAALKLHRLLGQKLSIK